MKKTAAVLMAVLMCTGVFSCKKKQQTPDTKTVVAEQLGDVAYTKEALALPPDMTQLYLSQPFSGGERNFMLGAGDTIPQFWTSDISFENCQQLDIPDFKAGRSYNIAAADDGTIVEFLIDADYGGLPDPPPSPEDYSSDEYVEAAEYFFSVRTYSEDGELLTEVPVTGCPIAPDANTSLSEFAAVNDCLIISIDFNYYVFGTDGRYIGELTAGGGENIEAIGSDGTDLGCAVRAESGSLLKVLLPLFG